MGFNSQAFLWYDKCFSHDWQWAGGASSSPPPSLVTWTFFTLCLVLKKRDLSYLKKELEGIMILMNLFVFMLQDFCPRAAHWEFWIFKKKRAVAAAMPKAKKEPMRSYNAFVLNKHKYSIKDPILVQSKGAAPFIGEIVKIEANPEDSKNVMLTLHWFYRPEVSRPSSSPLLFNGWMLILSTSLFLFSSPSSSNGNDAVLAGDSGWQAGIPWEGWSSGIETRGQGACAVCEWALQDANVWWVPSAEDQHRWGNVLHEGVLWGHRRGHCGTYFHETLYFFLDFLTNLVGVFPSCLGGAKEALRVQSAAEPWFTHDPVRCLW